MSELLCIGHVKLPKQTSREFLEAVCSRHHQEADGSSVLTTTFLCRRNPFVPVKSTDPFTTVLRALTTKGIHMVPIMNPEGPPFFLLVSPNNQNKKNRVGLVSACVSQTSIIPFLKRHEEALHGLFQKTVLELKLGTSPVISISSKVSTKQGERERLCVCVMCMKKTM